jgi:acyl carrier protein
MADGMTKATFDSVAEIISEVSSIERDQITPESHTINDLGIDSLDFLDVTFAIDKQFGIKMPVEQWMEDVNEGKASTDDFFIMKNLCGQIERLVADAAA